MKKSRLSITTIRCNSSFTQVQPFFILVSSLFYELDYNVIILSDDVKRNILPLKGKGKILSIKYSIL